MLSRNFFRILPQITQILRKKTNFFLIPRQSLIFKSYHEKVIDHYEKPRNVGSLNKNDLKVGTGLVGAPACGDVMKLQIKVNDDGVIENAVFKVYIIFNNSYLNINFRLSDVDLLLLLHLMLLNYLKV